jgi:hypothetical protein
MALNVNVYNVLDSGSGNQAHICVCNPLNPQAAGGTSVSETLNQYESLDIHIGDEDSGGEFQIRVKPGISSYPSLTIKRTGNHWKITNLGADTDTSVTVGPDGQ